MGEPVGYFITWTTKTSWLHGDERGSVASGESGILPPDEDRRAEALRAANNDAFKLSSAERVIVTETIQRHCGIRGWYLHAVNVRTQHVHVVVTANGVHPDQVMTQLKAWSSRNLNKQLCMTRKWWTEHGSTRWLNSEASLEDAVIYVRDMQ